MKLYSVGALFLGQSYLRGRHSSAWAVGRDHQVGGRSRPVASSERPGLFTFMPATVLATDSTALRRARSSIDPR